MITLGDKIKKIRSKNAGPFCVTIDLFCFDQTNYEWLCKTLNSEILTQLFKISHNELEIFKIPSLHTIKLSIPRPNIQGSRLDRDIHGAQFAELLNELRVD